MSKDFCLVKYNLKLQELEYYKENLKKLQE